MSGALAAVQFAGAVIGFAGKRKASRAARQLGRLNAQLILLETEVNMRRLRQQARKLVGAQASGYAKGGVQARSGSAYDVAMETQILAEQDVAIMKLEGNLRATIARRSGQAQASLLNYGAISDLLQGGAGAYQTASLGKT